MKPPHANGPDSSLVLSRAAPSRARSAEFGHAAGNALSMKWSALQDAAGVVSTLAGNQPEMRKPEIRNFPAIMRDTGGWRYELAKQGVDDLVSFMEPGLAALLAASARGVSPKPAALALWQEFAVTRAALLDLIPPLGINHR